MVVLYADRQLQNRYFPMIFQFWVLAGECLILHRTLGIYWHIPRNGDGHEGGRYLTQDLEDFARYHLILGVRFRLRLS